RDTGPRGRGNSDLLAALFNRTSPRSGDSGGTAHLHREGTKRLQRALAQCHFALPGGTRSSVCHRRTTTVCGSVMRQGWGCHYHRGDESLADAYKDCWIWGSPNEQRPGREATV